MSERTGWPTTILVGFDGTAPARRALSRAAELAETYAARVVVAAVQPESSHVPPSAATLSPDDPLLHEPAGIGTVTVGVVDVPAERAEERQPVGDPYDRSLVEARAVLESRGIRCEVTSPIGRPVDELLDVAELHGADLIVVGTREPGFFVRLFGGSVSGALARRARCDVLVVHPAHHEDAGA